MANKSKYIGVRYDKNRKKFYSTLTHQGVIYNCGYDVSDKVCAKLRDLTIIKLNLNKKKLQVIKPV
jgi:hypothetical protein